MLKNFHNRLTIRKGISFLFLLSLLCSVSQPTFSRRSEKRPKVRPIEIKTLNDTLIPSLVNKVASYTFTIDRDNFLLNHNYDLTLIQNSLPELESQIKNYRSIFKRVGQNMNLQGLSTSSIILKDVTSQLDKNDETLETYKADILKSNQKIKRILADSSLRIAVTDSALRFEMTSVLSDSRKIDTAQKLLLARINLLNSRVSVSRFESNDLISDMHYLAINKKINLFYPERSPLFYSDQQQYSQTTKAATTLGFRVGFKVIDIYLASRTNLLVWAFLLSALFYVWSIINIRQIKKKQDVAPVLDQMLFLNKRLLVVSFFLFFSIVPLFFRDPPIALLLAFGLFALAMLSLLLLPFLSKSFKKLWLFLVVIWLLFAWDNLLLHASLGDRWLVFIAGIIMIGICVTGLLHRREIFTQLKYSKVTVAVLSFSLLTAFLSVVCNLTGNFYLAKILGSTAIQSLILAVGLKILCTLILEAFYLQSEAFSESRLSGFLNFEKLRLRLLRSLWVLACLVWLAALLRDLTLYSWFSDRFMGLISTRRVVGKYHFTYSSVLIFLFVIWISSLISKTINYFFGYEKSIATGKRSGINSMALILRLCILTVGFLIAVAAAGIPLDKLSILLGALGVGIGFGLQTIVSNLVSGVILAFERPIQIGDQIEVGDQSGIVKEIGVRACKINNTEGADIIIPNGDLLSKHVINWTIQNRSRRIHFSCGISYKTDLEKLRTLVLEKLKSIDYILHEPESLMIISDFGSLAIELKIYFWVPEVNDLDPVRTAVMMEIKSMLADAGVELQARLINPYDLQGNNNS